MLLYSGDQGECIVKWLPQYKEGMRNRRIILRSVAEGVSLARVFSPLRSGLRILMYHSVGHHAYRDDEGIFSISQQNFHNHIRLLASTKQYKCVPLRPLNLPQHTMEVAVTLDDGYRDNLYIAAPVLVENNIPFTVFVSSDFIKNRIEGFLTPDELRGLAELPGVTIGAHGKSHRRLTDCSDLELRAELSSSKHYLEDLLGRPVTTVSYPFGAVNIRVRDEAERLGYDLGVCTRFDINIPGRDPMLLCRCNIEREDTPRVLHQKLKGDWDWYRFRSLGVLSHNA